jgi:hypothetical protein
MLLRNAMRLSQPHALFRAPFGRAFRGSAFLNRFQVYNNIPKGFEKYFPGATRPTPASASRSTTTSSSDDQDKESSSKHDSDNKQGGGGSGGSGGQKKKEPELGGIVGWMMVGSLLYLLSSLGGSVQQTPATTWQEFQANYLRKGLVERIIVLNQTTARVFLRPELSNRVIEFKIGSLDRFEEKLDRIQVRYIIRF